MAVIVSPPTVDKNINWTPSTAGSHYVLIDEGIARPITTDNVCTTAINAIESFNFAPTDNGEDIISVNFRAYVGGAIMGSPWLKIYLKDSVGGTWESVSALKPSAGIYKEVNEILTTNPITGLPWTFTDLVNYEIGFKSVAGDGFDPICVATLQIDITTESGLAQYNGERIGNI